MMPTALEYRIEKVENSLELLLEKADKEPKTTRNYFLSVVGAIVAILATLFAFLDDAISRRMDPLEVKITFIYESLVRMEERMNK